MLAIGSPGGRAASLPSLPVFSGGTVKAIAVSGSTAYVGGNFQYAGGTKTSTFVDLSSTGALAKSLPGVTSTVLAPVPDGGGGWYLGGGNGVVHVTASGSVDPNFSGSNFGGGGVYALVVSGSTLFVGGSFASATGTNGTFTRSDLAAFNVTNGSVLSWAPTIDPGDPSSTVDALAVSGSSVFAGGSFSAADGTTRNNLAAFDATTGSLKAWSPDVDGEVHALRVINSTVYAGGVFTSVNSGSLTRPGIAGFNTTDGTATDWSPSDGGDVWSIAISGSTLYFVADGFAGAISLTSGDDVPTWSQPSFDGPVWTVGVSGSTVYVGGAFQTINGTDARDNIAAFDASTGNLLSFAPVVGGGVDSIAIQSGDVFVGGAFAAVGGARYSGLAAIDLTTGQLTDWNAGVVNDTFSLSNGGWPFQETPDPIVGVQAILVSSSTVYVGGSFDIADGSPQSDAAAFNATSGALTSWDPEFTNSSSCPDRGVLSLAISGSTVYAGGNFTDVNTSTPRSELAAVDATTGAATSWNPDVQLSSANCGGVDTLSLANGNLYVGGSFDTVGATTRDNAASFSVTSGALTGWDPQVGDPSSFDRVNAIAANGSSVFIGGQFTVVGSTTRAGLAAVDPTSGSVLSWDGQLGPAGDAPASVTALALTGATLYVDGSFYSVNAGVARLELAALDATTASATSWNPGPAQGWTAFGYPGQIVMTDSEILVASGGGLKALPVSTLPAPTISSFSPSSGIVGDSVSVTGVDFSGATGVTLNGVSALFRVSDDALLSFTVPPGATSGRIVITTPSGSATSVGTYTVIAPPTISGFTPSQAGVHGTVRVTGAHLGAASAVKVNGTSAAFTVISDGALTFTVPSGATTGPIQVTNRAGTATSSTFTVLPAPTITSINPSSGSIGTSVTITGTSLTGTVGVRIGDIITVPTAVTSTTVTFTIPPGATSGPVTVLSPAGSATSSTPFTVTT